MARHSCGFEPSDRTNLTQIRAPKRRSYFCASPYHGLGQLAPEQLASVYDQRRPVSKAQFELAAQVERAFALQDQAAFARLSAMKEATLPWVQAAVKRWIEEKPDSVTSHCLG